MPTPHELSAFLSDLMPRLGAIAKDGYENPGPVEWKERGQPVTAIDRRIETLAREAIHQAWPGHAIQGEEHGSTPGNAPTTWYIDPIDGTMNFARGLPFFSVSIGAWRHDRMIAGSVLDPLRNEHFHAAAGLGAHLNERPLQLKPGRVLRDANVSLQTSAGSRYLKTPGFMPALQRRVAKTRRMGSIALEMAYVAAGRMDLVVGGRSKPQDWWDIAGAWAVLEESGGAVLDLSGKNLSPDSSHLVAGEPGLAREFIDWFESHPA